MIRQQLLMFIKGQLNLSGFNYELLMKDIEYLLYATAKRMRRRLDHDQVMELASTFFADMWEKKDQLPLGEEYCYGFAKRLVYSVIDTLREEVEVTQKVITCSDSEEFTDEFKVAVQYLPVHRMIKDFYISIVDQVSQDTLANIAKSKTFLGNVLQASFLRKLGSQGGFAVEPSGMLQSEFGGAINLSLREEEVLLGCTLVKYRQFWVLPQYILNRESLFICLLSFSDSLLGRGTENYFKNLFLSVRVFCEFEKMKERYEEPDVVRELSLKFSLRFRDVKNRYDRIARLMGKYDEYAKQCVDQFRRDLNEFVPLRES